MAALIHRLTMILWLARVIGSNAMTMICGNTQAEIDRDHTPKRVIDRSGMNEREPSSTIEQITYENIVYKNTVAALLAGAELTARNGKTKYMLYTPSTHGMTVSELELEARVLASYIVG